MTTMNCISCQEKMWDDAEGLLGAEERAALGQHLAECADCRAFFAREAALAAQLRTTLHQRADNLQLAPAARARVLAECTPQRAQSWWRTPALAAAAAALILCAAHFALRSSSTAAPHASTINRK